MFYLQTKGYCHNIDCVVNLVYNKLIDLVCSICQASYNRGIASKQRHLEIKFILRVFM